MTQRRPIQPSAKLISLRMRVQPFVINVAGELFNTTRTAIMREPKGLLASMIWGKCPAEVDPDGNIYVDRDPDLFKFVLRYLETGEGVNTLNNLDAASEIQGEARFFGLQKMLEELENRIQILSGDFRIVGKDQQYKSIKLAMESCSPNERIVIMPGIYHESVILQKPVRLIGKIIGDQRVIIETSQQPALVVNSVGGRAEGIEFKRVSDSQPGRQANVMCHCGHLMIVHNSETGCDMCDDCHAPTAPPGFIVRGCCVEVGRRAGITLKDCAVSSDVGTGMQVGFQATVDLRGVRVHDCNELGVLLLGGAASMKNSTVTGCRLAALGIQEGAEASIIRSKFSEGEDCGIVIERGRLQLVQSEICDNKGAGVAISDSPSGDVVLRNCQVRRNGHAGVYVCGENTSPQFVGMDIESNGMAGMTSTAQASPQLQNCRLFLNKGCGFLAIDGGRGNVTRCDIRENSMAGICIQGAKSELKIYESEIHHGFDSGIFVTKGATSLIKGCSVHTNALAGIAVSDQARPKVLDCNLYACRVGLSLFEGCAGHYERLDIFNNKTANVAVETAADPTMLRCKIQKGSAIGILLERGARGVYGGNEILSNSVAGVVVRDPKTNPTFSENTIASNAMGIIFSDGCTAALHKDVIEKNNGIGVVCKSGARPCISKAIIRSNGSAGVVVGKNARGVFLDCVISDNGGVGISVGESARPLIKGCVVSGCVDCGVIVLPGATPELHANTIREHDLASVALEHGADPRFFENKIKGGATFAVLCGEGSMGAFEYNEVSSGSRAGFGFIRTANPVLLNNEVDSGVDGDFVSYGDSKIPPSEELIATVEQQRRLRPREGRRGLARIRMARGEDKESLSAESLEEISSHESQVKTATLRAEKGLDISETITEPMNFRKEWVPRQNGLASLAEEEAAEKESQSGSPKKKQKQKQKQKQKKTAVHSLATSSRIRRTGSMAEAAPPTIPRLASKRPGSLSVQDEPPPGSRGSSRGTLSPLTADHAPKNVFARKDSRPHLSEPAKDGISRKNSRPDLTRRDSRMSSVAPANDATPAAPLRPVPPPSGTQRQQSLLRFAISNNAKNVDDPSSPTSTTKSVAAAFGRMAPSSLETGAGTPRMTPSVLPSSRKGSSLSES